MTGSKSSFICPAWFSALRKMFSVFYKDALPPAPRKHRRYSISHCKYGFSCPEHRLGSRCRCDVHGAEGRLFAIPALSCRILSEYQIREWGVFSLLPILPSLLAPVFSECSKESRFSWYHEGKSPMQFLQDYVCHCWRRALLSGRLRKCRHFQKWLYVVKSNWVMLIRCETESSSLSTKSIVLVIASL